MASRKKIKVLHPPKGSADLRMEPVICQKCSKEEQVETSKKDFPSWGKPIATCSCGGIMVTNVSAYRPYMTSRGPGFHETKVGQRRKREMTKRNERLAKTQWSNHQPVQMPEGKVARNYTPGGPYDPNGPFAKKKSKAKIVLK